MKKKSVLIVGATSGIGRALAERFLRDGAVVGVTGRRAELLEDLKCKWGEDRVFVSVFDATDRSRAGECIDELIGRMGGIDTFIYNAGYGHNRPMLDEEIEMNTVDVNVCGFTQAVCRAFNYFAREGRGGHIVATSSIASVRGLGVATSYSATKMYIVRYMEALNQKSSIMGAGIRFTTLKPGFIDTDFISGKHYPMTLKAEYAFDVIYRKILKEKRVAVVDWKWALVVAVWKLIPGWLWVKMKVS